MWQQDPRGFWEVLSASGSFRKLEIWILFSARDPNSRSNVGNCFEVELWKKTSSPEKLGTSRIGRMPQVWIHPWRYKDPSKNLKKGWFLDPQRYSFYRTTGTVFANGKGQNQRKIGVPWWNSDIPTWWTIADSENLNLIRGIPNWGIPSRKFNSWHLRNLHNAKSLSSHARQCMAIGHFRELWTLPKFLFGDQKFRFGQMTRTDPKGHP